MGSRPTSYARLVLTLALSLLSATDLRLAPVAAGASLSTARV